MRTLSLTAYAKVNLALDILGRRDDGYHTMRMVMQAVSLGDTVTVTETAGGFALLAEGLELPPDRKTMEQQAAEAFFAALGRPVPGLEVRLEKKVPAYAGLGGGSADVAAVLRCLRRLYCPEMPMEELRPWGPGGQRRALLPPGRHLPGGGQGGGPDGPAPAPKCAFVLCAGLGLPTPALFARVDGGDLGRRPDVDGMAAALARGT